MSNPISKRFAHAKAAYTTRHTKFDKITTFLSGEWVPRSGDLVLARVEHIGHHGNIELANSR